MLDNLCCKVLSVVGVDRSGDFFTGAEPRPSSPTPADTKEPEELGGIALFFRIDSHLFFVGALPASCVRPEHRLSSGVGGRRDEGCRVGRLGWRLGWGWGKGSAPWLGACQQELGWGMLGPGEEGGEAGVLT